MVDQKVSEAHTRCQTCKFGGSGMCKLFQAARNISSRYKDSLEIMIVSRLDNELNTSGKDIMIMECTGYAKCYSSE